MKIWNVSYMATPNDNGHCVSFFSEESAKKCAEELKNDGAFHVRIWLA